MFCIYHADTFIQSRISQSLQLGVKSQSDNPGIQSGSFFTETLSQPTEPNTPMINK